MTVREKYSHAKADRQQELKRKEAEGRDEQRAKRTDEQQLKLIEARRGASAKESKRLTERIRRNK